MLVALSPLGGAGTQFFDANGSLLVGGRLYTYAAGTTTPLATYTDSTGNTAHTNPIELDSAGRVPGGAIWLSLVGYKFVLTDANDSVISTWDGIRNIDATGVPFTPPANLGFGVGTNTVSEGLVDLANNQINTAATNTPPGAILMYGGTTAPSGWLVCDGSAKAAADYTALFAVIGSTFNTGGEGTGNFRLPDLRSRFPIGAGTGGLFTTRDLGSSGGEEKHTLDMSEIPYHHHTVPNHSHTYEKPTPTGAYLAYDYTTSGSGDIPVIGIVSSQATGDAGAGNTSSEGVGLAHNNMPPFLAVNFIIKT